MVENIIICKCIMENQIINRENVKQFCRTCLSWIASYSDVDDRGYNISKMEGLSKWINIFTSSNFHTKDKYPSFICQVCYRKLQSFNEFNAMCLQSEQTLDKILGDESGTPINVKVANSGLGQNDNYDVLVKLNLEESKNWLENNEDDKSLITPAQINSIKISDVTNSNNSYIDEFSENCKLFEYKNCNEAEAEAEEHIKLSDIKDDIEIDAKNRLSENEAQELNEKVTKKTGLRKSKVNCNYKITSSSKRRKIPIENNTSVSTQQKDLKVSRGKLSCTICELKFYKQASLNGHIRRDHQGLKPFQCDKCERGYNKAYRLKLHMSKAHSNPINEEVICNIDGCGVKLLNNASYKTHYHNKHTERANLLRKFICEDCGSSFKNMISLKKHRYKHGPPEAYPFHCEQCDKRFSTKYKFKQHQDRHAGIKNFECPYCGLKKTTNDELRTHINYHTKERQWPCSACNSVFNSSGGLCQHVRIVHQKIRRYACRYCGDSFGKPETLKHHEMRHTGEKPHECQICGKRFIQQVALRTHLKTHEKIKKQ